MDNIINYLYVIALILSMISSYINGSLAGIIKADYEDKRSPTRNIVKRADLATVLNIITFTILLVIINLFMIKNL
jgi:hypothetical protein